MGLVVPLLVLVACGVSPERHPHVVDDDKVPFGLLTTSTTTATTATTATGGTAVTLCFHRGPVVVPVGRSSPQPAAGDVLHLFLEGPSSEEAADGFSTAVFDPRIISSVGVTAGVATVELSQAFTEAGARVQLDVIVELVCTLTAQPGIGQVAFQLRGERVEVPRGDGSLTSQPVSRDDYRTAIPST